MNEKNYELVNREIEGGLEQLSTFDPSDKGYKEGVDSLEVLWKLKLEEDKLELERQKLELKKNEDEAEQKKFDKQKIFEYATMGIGLLTFTTQLVAYGKWLKTGMTFEETGTFTSKTVQGLTRLFKPTNK